MESKNKPWVKWLSWFTFAVAIIVVYKILDSFNDVKDFLQNLINILMPFVIGILIAYIFYIPCKKIEELYRKSKSKIIVKKSRGLAIFTVYCIIIIFCIFTIKFIFPTISQSITDLINNLPGYYSNTLKSIQEAPEDSFLRKINAEEIINSLQKIDLKQMLNVETIFQYAKGVISFATGIFDFFVAIIVSIYLLLERRRIINFFRDFASVTFKRDTYKIIGKYFRKSNDIIFKFLSSQLIDSIIVGIVISIALSVMNVKYGVLLGVMIGLFNMIPFLGAIIAVVVAVLITLLTGGLTQAIWVTIVIVVLQQIDANIINPKITGDSLEISPILVIFSVTIGGAYFGILGMILAVPICTVVKLLIIDYIKEKKRLKE